MAVRGAGTLREVALIAFRDLSRFWRYKFWLAGQLAMNLSDIAIFALLISNIVRRDVIPDYFKYMTPGVVAIATFASAFSIGREVGVELRREITDYLLSLPVRRISLVIGRILGGALRGLVYQLPFLVLAALLVGTPTLDRAAHIALASTLLTTSMSSLAIAISTATRDFNLQATLRSITYYFLFFLSNVFYPVSVLQRRFSKVPALIPVIEYSPVSLASDIYRWGFGYYAVLEGLKTRVLCLSVWSIAITVAASYIYLTNLTRR